MPNFAKISAKFLKNIKVDIIGQYSVIVKSLDRVQVLIFIVSFSINCIVQVWDLLA